MNRFIVIAGKTNISTIESYLYRGNVVLAQYSNGSDLVVLLDCQATEGTGFNCDAQSDRLWSGCHGNQLFEGSDEAVRRFLDWSLRFTEDSIPRKAVKS